MTARLGSSDDRLLDGIQLSFESAYLSMSRVVDLARGCASPRSVIVSNLSPNPDATA